MCPKTHPPAGAPTIKDLVICPNTTSFANSVIIYNMDSSESQKNPRNKKK
jgi:hypothetical protein